MIELKIKTLRKGWHDKDHILLHAAFQLLVDFVELEKPAKHIDWSWDVRHRKAWKEIMSLYRWWTKERPRRRDILETRRVKRPEYRRQRDPESGMIISIRPDRKKYAAYYRLLDASRRQEERWEAEDQKNLRRLIDIRGYLWT